MFHVGQKVVCVDASVNPYWGPNDLVKGAIYTVHRMQRGVCLGVCLVEVKTQSPAGFDVSRFRPVVERKTSTGFAILEEIRRKNSKKVPDKKRFEHSTSQGI